MSQAGTWFIVTWIKLKEHDPQVHMVTLVLKNCGGHVLTLVDAAHVVCSSQPRNPSLGSLHLFMGLQAGQQSWAGWRPGWELGFCLETWGWWVGVHGDECPGDCCHNPGGMVREGGYGWMLSNTTGWENWPILQKKTAYPPGLFPHCGQWVWPSGMWWLKARDSVCAPSQRQELGQVWPSDPSPVK